MSIKYSEGKVSVICSSEIIFLCKSLKYCALGTVGIQEHPFHTDLQISTNMRCLSDQPKLNLRFLHLIKKEKKKKSKSYTLVYLFSVNSSCKQSW